MSYCRVIPRDLFNEGNLLKCYGALYIALDSGPNMTRAREARAELVDLFDRDEPFKIVMDESDGSLSIANVRFMVGGRHVPLRRPLNSREPYPLWADNPFNDEFETFEVFNDDGTLHEDMIEFLDRVVAGTAGKERV